MHEHIVIDQPHVSAQPETLQDLLIQKLESQWRDHLRGVHGIELPVPQGVGRIIPYHGKLVGGFGHRVSNLWHVEVCKIITEALFGYPLFRPLFA